MVTTTASSIMYSTKKKNYTVPRIGLLNSRYEGIGLRYESDGNSDNICRQMTCNGIIGQAFADK